MREARIKDERGPDLFNELKNYIANQVAKYNQGKGHEVLTMADETALNASGGCDFTVRSKDGLGHPLIVAYRPHSHTVEWRCGPNRGLFKLRVRDDGEVYLETPNHCYRSIEEISTELLTTLQASARQQHSD